MVLIREIVQKDLTSGYLTVEAENKLRELLAKFDLEDLDAFMTLQRAIIAGYVKQESEVR